MKMDVINNYREENEDLAQSRTTSPVQVKKRKYALILYI